MTSSKYGPKVAGVAYRRRHGSDRGAGCAVTRDLTVDRCILGEADQHPLFCGRSRCRRVDHHHPPFSLPGMLEARSWNIIGRSRAARKRVCTEDRAGEHRSWRDDGAKWANIPGGSGVIATEGAR